MYTVQLHESGGSLWNETIAARSVATAIKVTRTTIQQPNYSTALPWFRNMSMSMEVGSKRKEDEEKK